MAQSELPTILQDAPSHFNWKLESGTCKTFEALDLNIKEHIQFNPNEMPVQAHLFQSFLYMSSFKTPTPDFKRFQDCLEEAYEKIETLADEDEKSAYTLVAKCNEAIVARSKLKAPNTDIEDDIEDLMEDLTDQSQACIDSVRAFALSRLGLPKYEDTEKYYRHATEVYPEKTDWLFGLALVIGRQARHNAPPYTFTPEMEAEKALLEKVLTLDSNHALAQATLSQCLLLKQDNDDAIEHANKAVESEPNNTYILSMAGTTFRKMSRFDDAIRVFQQACKLESNDHYLHHQHGLVYRAKYYTQIKTATKDGQNKKEQKEPDTNLLREALCCFTKAVEANSTNTMALLDKARALAELGETEKADEEYTHLIATDNLSPSNRFTFNYRYAVFLREKRNDDKKAAKKLRTAIDNAVTHCTTEPVTRNNPTPKFKGLTRDFKTASQNYREIMEALADSADPQSQSEGLSGLGWLHQVLGEHEAAKDKYQAYLKNDGKSKDHKVIQQLIRSLIQLDDLEEATKQIALLKTIKPRLWKDCHIDCILREAEIALGDPGSKDKAMGLFREAIGLGSLEGCEKLADNLDTELVATWKFRSDCAQILHCCQKKNETIVRLACLEDETFGPLRMHHLDMELLRLENSIQVLQKASQVFNEAKSLLDRAMSEFQRKHYPARENSRCMFFYIAQKTQKKPMQVQEVRGDIVQMLTRQYKWENFETKFTDLLDFLVQIQPAFPGNDNWCVASSKLNNFSKHCGGIKHSQYHIPVILNGKSAKEVSIIPDGPNGPIECLVPDVKYDKFDVIEVARRATTEVERIVAEFHKYL